MYHHHSGSTASQPKRRKKRPVHGVKTVEVTRGKSGYGFTISGQNPCVLSVIVPGSPADVAGLKSGDYLVTVGSRNVTKELHDDVVRMVGLSTGTLVLQVAENYNSSDSSDDEYQHRHKARYPNRVRSRHATNGSRSGERVLSELNREKLRTDYKHKDPHLKQDPRLKSSHSRAKINKPLGAENNYSSSNSSHDSTPQFAGPLPIEKKAVSSRSNLHATPLMQHNHHQAKQAVVKTFPQSAQATRHVGENHRSEWRNRTSISPSLHGSFLAPGISSYLKTSAQQNQTNCADNAFLIADDEEGDDEESLLNYSFHEMRVVVGYIGSIEMPSDAHKPHIRVQSIRSAVRRLRVEQKIHTLVLMEVSQDGVKLTNTMGTTIAHYPAGIISFSGVCPDDKRFFGIVTLHSSISDHESDNDGASQEERDPVTSGSCHVFMVDPEMKSHNIHAQKAKDFGITCTPNVDRHLCAEFPKSATPVIMSITNLYKDRAGAGGDSEAVFSQAFSDPSRAPQRSSSNSSNSDSGLGFGRGAPPQPLVQGAEGGMPEPPPQEAVENWSGESVQLDHGPVQQYVQPQCSPGIQTMPTPYKQSLQSINTTRDGSMTNGHTEFVSPSSAMHPPSKSLSHETTARVVKLNEYKQMHNRSEQNLTTDDKLQGSKSISRTFSHPDLKRPTSAPFKQISESSAFTNYQLDKNKVEAVEMEDRLSPRAMLPPPFHQLRSPSAPPSVGQRIDDSDSDSNDFEFPMNTSGMGGLIERFEQDHALRISSPANVSRRFSEGFAITQQREKEKVPDDGEKWLKPNTVRHRRVSRLQQPLSHSHESLVALEHEISNHRLSSAGSVNNIACHMTAEEEVKEEDIGRVAGWAVNFDKLLKDPSGLIVFTEFLKKEFSQENIIFWRAVEQYKQIKDGDKRKAKAKDIFNTYISVKAADPINIEQMTRQQVEKQLDNPNSNTFDRPQQDIFKLMKQDSYPRFIKSDLYKEYLMREMEGRPLDLPTEEGEGEGNNKGGKKEDKKKKGKETEEKDKEKRRRSLLPWRHKNSKQSLKATSDTDLKKGNKEKEKMSVSASSVKEKEVNNNTQRKPAAAGPGIDLSTIRKEVQASSKEMKEKETEEKDVKFCRVTLPDGSTTVVCTKPGQTIRTVLGKLCDKRGLSIAAVEVMFHGSEKPIDLSEDVSSLGSREVTIERRVLFRMDLANKKSIGVKAKPNRSVRDVFKPILNKYGFKIDNVSVQLAGQTGYVDIEEQVSTIDNQRVVVIPHESTPAPNHRSSPDKPTSNRYPAVVKYPQDMHRLTKQDNSSLDVITNCIFEDLMMGKSESAHNFDELGILDPGSKVKDPQKDTGEARSLGLFGLLKKETPSAKQGLAEQAKTKTKHKVTFNLQKNQTRRSDPDDDRFFDLLSRVQSARMEDQRGVGSLDSDMPDFLRTNMNSGRESAPPILSSRPVRMAADMSDYVQNDNEVFASYTRGQVSARPSSVPVGRSNSAASETNFDSVDGSDSFSHGNQSFSTDGVIPSYEEAEQVFQSTAPDSPDFDDPCLADKTLRDTGAGYNYNMYQAKAWGYSRHRPQFSSSRHIQNSQFKRAPMAAPERYSFDESSNIVESDEDRTLVSSPVDENFRPHSVPPSMGNGAVHYLSPISPRTSPGSQRSSERTVLSTPLKLSQIEHSTPKPNFNKYKSAFHSLGEGKENSEENKMDLSVKHDNSDKAMVVDLGSPQEEDNITFV